MVALRRESPWESHGGSKEKLIWDLFPHHLTASTAWWCSSGCQSRAKQGKLFLEEFLLPKQNSPLLSHHAGMAKPPRAVSQGCVLA